MLQVFPQILHLPYRLPSDILLVCFGKNSLTPFSLKLIK